MVSVFATTLYLHYKKSNLIYVETLEITIKMVNGKD